MTTELQVTVPEQSENDGPYIPDVEVDEWLPATVVNLEYRAPDPDQDSAYGKPKPQYEWEIHIDGHWNTDGDQIPTRAWTTVSFHEKSTLHKWLTGLGYKLAAGENINLAELIGARVDVMFEWATKQGGPYKGQQFKKLVKIRRSKAPDPDETF